MPLVRRAIYGEKIKAVGEDDLGEEVSMNIVFVDRAWVFND